MQHVRERLVNPERDDQHRAPRGRQDAPTEGRRAASEEGRRVYDNLVKALAFLLPTNLGQALIIAVAVLAGAHDLPVTPVQILWINLIVAVALALPLAFEAPEPASVRLESFWRLPRVSAEVAGRSMAHEPDTSRL